MSQSRAQKKDGPPPRKGDAERSVPHDPRVEQALCGALLFNPEAIVAAAPLLHPTDLFTGRCRAIYAAAEALFNEHLIVNPTTLRHRLEAEGTFEDIGGEKAFMECQAECLYSSLEAVESYARIIADYSVNRRLVQGAGQIAAAAYEHTREEAVRRANSIVLDATSVKGGDAPKPIAELVQRWEDNTDPLLGLATGIDDLDDLTGGLHDGEIWTIAARPGVGKTAFVTQIMRHITGNKAPTVFFSLEMSHQQVLMRMLSAEARINIQAVYRNQLEPEERSLVAEGAQKIKRLPLFIDDTGALPVEQLRTRALRLHHLHGVRLLVIDYIQLLRTEERKGTRNDDVAFISTTLTQMAKDLSCPILLVSQLRRTDKRPELTDLRDSGQIEQDAHVVCFLHTEDPGDEGPSHSLTDPSEGEVELIIAKQRNGPTGARVIRFDRTCGRFG